MTLYEPKENDEVYEIEGIKFVVDKELQSYAEGLKIELGESNFGGKGVSIRYVGERGGFNGNKYK